MRTMRSGMSAVKKAPRYQEILEIIRARISSNQYPLGKKLPSESQFCTEFGASRFTVREALRRLQAEGLVESNQGAGSRVLRKSASGVFIQSHRSVSELSQFSLETHYNFLESEKVVLDEQTASLVGGAGGETWCVIRALRQMAPDRRPLSFVESYLPIRFEALVPHLSLAQVPLYSILEIEHGERVIDATQSAQALEMPKHISTAMSVPEGSISLRLLRHYKSTKGTLISSFNWHHGGDRFIHRTKLLLEVNATK